MSTIKIKKQKKNITQKYKHPECIAVLNPDKNIPNNNVYGVVEFLQRTNYLEIRYNISNLTDGEHGFHIHEYGDLTEGCSSGCSHFNPTNSNHGGLKCRNCHAGDLGNINSINGLSKGIIRTNKVTLQNSIRNIIGRMIIVHADRDDLGKGDNAESLKTGNAGKRLACGVIGIRKN